VTLLTFLDLAAEFILRHQLEQHGECVCDVCTDLKGAVYFCEFSASTLECGIKPSEELRLREEAYRRHDKARRQRLDAAFVAD
jgi:hypothetical protein